MGVSTEGRFAHFYDFFFDGILRPIRMKNLAFIKNHHCETIIDLGCGTGSQSILLSKNNFQVKGLDQAKQMIRVARGKTTDESQFIHADIIKNSLPDEWFDCAIITLVLHPNPKETITSILQEAERLVKRQGLILITDYDIGKGIKARFASLVVQIIESMANQSHRTHYFEFLRRGGLEQVLCDRGYQIEDVESFFYGAVKTCVVRNIP
jgi:demethylmenaquinone methyltransferase/2-methoxy-6-polyprenyl-1,4-benzoquinol methylase